MLGHATEDTPIPGPLGIVVGHSYDAVDLFFILSGFVLALRYDRPFADGRARPFRRFLAHRVARLYPLYALGTLGAWVMARCGVPIYGAPHVSFAALGANLLAVQFWCWPIDSIDGPGWSISVEAAANLAFPFLVAVLLHRTARSAAIATALAFATIAATAIAATGEYWGTPILLRIGHARLAQPLPGGIAEFALGLACYRLGRDRAESRRLGHGLVAPVLLVLIVGWTLSGTPDVLFDALGCGLVLALAPDTGPLARLLGRGPCHALGRWSYPLYLVHAPILSLIPPLHDRLARADVPHAVTLATVAVLGGAVAVAAVLHRLVETPSRRALQPRCERWFGAVA